MDIKAYTDHALAKLHVQIEADTIGAKIDLELPHDGTALAAAQHVLDEVAPLFVHTIQISGETSRDMYDEHPGMAYYQTSDSLRLEAPPYCGLAQARELADKHMAAMLEESAEYGDDRDGAFYPQMVQLLDHAGRTLQVFDQKTFGKTAGWLEPVTSEMAVKLVEQAQEMRRDASEEIRGDNFESARHLRDRAMEFIAQASTAKLAARAIP